MKKTIWKFPLEIADRQVVDMPKGAQILNVQLQNGEPFAWAIVDPKAPCDARTILVLGTGHSIEDDLRYLGTVQVNGGALVFHFFEPANV